MKIVANNVVVVLVLCIAVSSCQRSNSNKNESVVEIWAHSGQANERNVLQDQIKRYNDKNKQTNIKLTFIPERTYNSQIQAAALAKDLPDLIEFDGPYLYNYIWQGHLLPLDERLAQTTIQNLIPSIIQQGTYNGKLYSVGAYDSGLGIYARKSALMKISARIPDSIENAWTIDEFNTILSLLAKQDSDGKILDLKLNYPGEWLTFAFSPILQSSGGDLINRKTYKSAQQVLNSSSSTQALEHFQSWIKKGYVDENIDDAAFVQNRVALSWSGHWEYLRYAKKFKDDLILLPLPNFGLGVKTGQGSWSWGLTQYSKNPDKAIHFLEFLLSKDEVNAIANANGAVPAHKQSIEESKLYSTNGPLRLFAEQLVKGYSVPRPKTPAYPIITSTFQSVIRAVRDGSNVQQELNKAVIQIDLDIADNHGYVSSVP